MTYTEWIAQAERSSEYKRERFRQLMAVRYKREAWRQSVIKEYKERRKNNLRRNTKRSYTVCAKWRFER